MLCGLFSDFDLRMEDANFLLVNFEVEVFVKIMSKIGKTKFVCMADGLIIVWIVGFMICASF